MDSDIVYILSFILAFIVLSAGNLALWFSNKKQQRKLGDKMAYIIQNMVSKKDFEIVTATLSTLKKTSDTTIDRVGELEESHKF